MKLTIIGTGYVGLVTGVCLANSGHHVTCLDIDKKKINNLNKGIMPIYENNLKSLVETNFKKNRIKFTHNISQAINYSNIIFIAVDTPPKKNGQPNMNQISKVAQDIATFMTSEKIIVQKSTVPVGTSDFIIDIIEKTFKKIKKNPIKFSIASNPEFLKEGTAIDDFMKPDRIIIGTNNFEHKAIFDEIYSPFNRKSTKIQYMDIRSAELTKYAANAILATKISFINELSNIADKLDVDIENIRKGIGADKRIGYDFLYPGCGYGGSCLPKDINALISSSKDVQHNPLLLTSVDKVNAKQKLYLCDKIKKHFKNKLSGKKIGIWGLAFKPNTDDVRFAPSIDIVKYLLSKGCVIKAYDPIASLSKLNIISHRNYKEVRTFDKAIRKSDALVICTEWKEFWGIELSLIKKLLNTPVIFDGRNIYDLEKIKENHITYYGIGRKKT